MGGPDHRPELGFEGSNDIRVIAPQAQWLPTGLAVLSRTAERGGQVRAIRPPPTPDRMDHVGFYANAVRAEPGICRRMVSRPPG
jgi:hypothetical protein